MNSDDDTRREALEIEETSPMLEELEVKLDNQTEHESILSYDRLAPNDKIIRTQNTINAETNLFKMFIGIAIVAFPYSMSWVGIIAAFLGILILMSISIASAYLLLKARNRYKDQVIVDLPDLGYACYGSKMKLLC